MKTIPNTHNPLALPALWCRPHWVYGIYSQLPAAILSVTLFALGGLEDMPFQKVMLVVATALGFLVAYNALYYILMEFELSDEQLTVATGIFDKDIERIELYRVCDYRVTRPFLLRIIGLENIRLYSTDRTMPALLIPAMRTSDRFVDEIRRRVETQKQRKRVYELVNR